MAGIQTRLVLIIHCVFIKHSTGWSFWIYGAKRHFQQYFSYIVADWLSGKIVIHKG
jgi:hypothetical protein